MTTSERRVTISALASHNDVKLIIRECQDLLHRGSGRLVLDLEAAEGFFPNAVVPAAAIVQQTRKLGGNVAFQNVPDIAEKMGLRNPLEVTEKNLHDYDVVSKTWVYFGHEQANLLTKAYISSLRHRIVCEAGVLDALEWCLYEVLDNVNQHSCSDQGFVMLQHHKQSGRLAFAIADTGIGIHRSLGSSKSYKPKNAVDAITLAIREGVTRDSETNQGNGLFLAFLVYSSRMPESSLFLREEVYFH